MPTWSALTSITVSQFYECGDRHRVVGDFKYYVSTFLGFVDPPPPPASAYVIYEWSLGGFKNPGIICPLVEIGCHGNPGNKK